MNKAKTTDTHYVMQEQASEDMIIWQGTEQECRDFIEENDPEEESGFYIDEITE